MSSEFDRELLVVVESHAVLPFDEELDVKRACFRVGCSIPALHVVVVPDCTFPAEEGFGSFGEGFSGRHRFDGTDIVKALRSLDEYVGLHVLCSMSADIAECESFGLPVVGGDVPVHVFACYLAFEQFAVLFVDSVRVPQCYAGDNYRGDGGDGVDPVGNHDSSFLRLFFLGLVCAISSLRRGKEPLFNRSTDGGFADDCVCGSL